MPGASGGIEGDLFGKLYTYEELQTVERPKTERAKPDWARDLTRPAHWPTDTIVEPGKWVYWLPDGWGQGIKTTNTGGTLKCFISSADREPVKRFFHKPDVEKCCARYGWPGLKEEEPVEKGEKEKVVKTVHDTIPVWPEWDLPKDWRIGFKQLPSGPHKIYVPPGQDEGFLYHRTCVVQYLDTGKKLASFAESKPMVEKMLIAAENSTQKKKKRKVQTRIVTIQDYVDCEALVMAKVSVQTDTSSAIAKLVEVGVSNADEVASMALQLHNLLLKRGFPNDTGHIFVSSRTPVADGTIVSLLCGHYYQMPNTDRPCYQKLQSLQSSHAGLICADMYISRSDGEFMDAVWQIGGLASGIASVAINKDDQQEPESCKSAWQVLRDDFLRS